jgi:hypothetical protein
MFGSKCANVPTNTISNWSTTDAEEHELQRQQALLIRWCIEPELEDKSVAKGSK